MAKKSKGGVELIALVCTETGLRNYTTKKNRRNNPEKLELMKYCPKLRVLIQVSSSNGRAAVSKTVCWGFESLLTCVF